ncbi:MAG: ECF transporter S component [Candidatus Promineifilaceae bacterium]|jgi:energy-coupling factor transport system substrate-specific component
MNKALASGIFIISMFIGVGVFLYPLILPAVSQSTNSLGGDFQQSQALTMVLLTLTIGVLLLEMQGQTTSAKTIAAMGLLIAATSVLRFIEVAIPGPGGFSPIFVPIIIAGYVFGARFGFLMGSLTMLVSALLTGGVGPWLPYQMFAVGWVGLTAGLLPQIENPIAQITMLAVFAFIWGLLYGLLMNLYYWPFLSSAVSESAETVQRFGATLANYGAFYLATSFVWDLTRGIGNLVLMIALGLPAVRALERFRDKFRFEVVYG